MNLNFFRTNIRPLLAIATFLLALTANLSAQQAGTSPVKIFLMIGQSNTQGHGELEPPTTEGTLRHLVANDPGNNYQFLVDGNGDWVERDDAWIHYERSPGNLFKGGVTVGYGANSAGTTIGPELGFGYHVGELFDEQVLIVKCAWGGKSLGNDFLPPSSGPYPAPQQAGDTGFYYQEILRLVNEATTNIATDFPDYDGNGFEISGICWHQGWNDRVTPAFSAAYEANMANFINDLRSDLETPDLPFVIATSAMDASPDVYSQVEIAQLKMDNSTGEYPTFSGNVTVVNARLDYAYDGGLTLDFWQSVESSPANQGFHWNRNAKTYLHLGLAMGDAMSTLSPARCPSRLRASAGTSGGVELIWQNGEEIPTSVQVLRGGVEIAATAPSVPAAFSDSAALPGLLDYQLIFTMAGDPCDPLTVTFNGGVTDLEAFRASGGVGLTWSNGMTYNALEIRRDGILIEATLSGTATSYLDTNAPSAGLVTYTVAPTTGTSAPTSFQIDLNAAPSGNALVYEPFDYPTGSLNSQSGISEVGLEGAWTATTALVSAGSLTYGALPTAGNSASTGGGSNNFGGARSIRASALSEAGLLDDGVTVWFSALVGYGTGGNLTNSRLALALANNSFSTSNFNYNIINSGTGSGLGLTLGRFSGSNGRVVATEFTDGSGGGFGSNTFGTETAALFGTGVHGLIVGRIEWGATSDTITLYNPDTDLVLPASAISTLTVNVDQATFDTITWARGDAVVMDEIRFGASYDDVIGAGGAPDNSPPTPDPAGFVSAPAADSDSAISMTAQTGTDASGPVEYLFTETSGNPGASDSDWQTSPTYTDSGLQTSTTYSYTVTMRDRLGNTGAASSASPATTNTIDSLAPTPNPMTWATEPAAISNTEITMTATTASDASGVEYYFTATSAGGNDSGWQDSPIYTDTGLTPSTTYTYTVKARDKSVSQNETTESGPPLSATTNDSPSGPGGAIAHEPFDYSAGGLGSANGGTGFSSAWTSNGTTNVVATNLDYGSLPGSGGSIGNLSGSQNRFGASRSIDLATPGLLANGAELWFSAIMGYDAGGNRTNTTLMLILGDEPMSGGNFDYNYNTLGATGLGAFLGRGSNNGTIRAVQIRDTSFGNSGFSGNVNGTGGDTVVVPNSDGNTNVDYRLVVGRITWGAASDTIDLFLPDTDLNLGAVHSTLTVDVDQSGFDSLTFKRGDKVVLDEIRFGASYDDVIGMGGAPNDYETWATGYPGANLTDPQADLDNDGLTNNEERIWGLDPTSGGSSTQIISFLDPSTGAFSYQRRNPDFSGATFSYQYSTTLASNDWTTFTPVSENPSGASQVETVEITVPTAILASPELFIRVLAE